jgi:type IV pilus assembly protein PilC
MAYPLVVLLAAVGVAAFMVIQVIPVMQKFLAGRGRRLPALTQTLINVSEWTQKWLPWLAVGLLGGVVLLAALYRYPPTRLVMDAFLLRIPLFGKAFRIAGTALFARGLSLLLENGVTLLDALKTTAGLMSNKALGRRVEQAREAVLAGAPLSKRLAHPGEFMPMLPRMTAVGEETGTLGRVLDETARFHESQLAAWVRRMAALVEPMVVVVVGGVVGFVYIAFFVALFSLAGGGR